MRVDTSLKDVLELLRFSVFAVEQAGEVDVEEGGTVEYEINVEALRNKRPATRLTCDPDRTGLCRCNHVSSNSARSPILALTLVPEVNRLLVEHGLRDHTECDSIPHLPQRLPFGSCGNATEPLLFEGRRCTLSWTDCPVWKEERRLSE